MTHALASPTWIATCIVAAFSVIPLRTTAAEQSAGAVDFARDIVPIFEQHCIRCHQPNVKKGDLSLATRAELDANDFLSPGNPDESYLLEVVMPAGGAAALMPKESPPLNDREIKLLRSWIASGAEWPDRVMVKERAKADRSWWSLQKLTASDPPAPENDAEWSANPIDRFIAAKLAEKRLRHNPPADRRALIRRVTYDLTGLPPTPADINAFFADASTDAYEKLVDRLLASSRYGEHFARDWLDVVRFGESTGFEVNHLVDNAWPYRDYVIRSFNDDKSFDRFIMEQLAGDAFAPGDSNVEIGLAFLVCGPVDIVGNKDAVQAAQIRADAVDDMIRATGETFLGLTIGCARCHDHKFDPITQRDYYSLYATLAGVFHDDRIVATEAQKRERTEKTQSLQSRKKAFEESLVAESKTPTDAARLSHLRQQIAEVDQQLASVPPLPTLPIGRFEQPAPDQCIFERGDAQKKGEHVEPASISTLADAATGYELPSNAPEQLRRLALARWIVSRDNPLTPRVLANRIWKHHFGTGIVATPNDFGYMGERPTHPELLDWLAQQLIDNHWRLKPLQKLIVMSQTYKQASTYRAEAAKVDADSRLLWRFPPQRLTAEEIRDTMLFVSGKLDERMGGPGFRLYQYSRDNVATYTPLDTFGPETYRRSLYHQNARASRIDLLSDFDAPDCAFGASRRTPTTTPLQSLALMNHSFTMTMAQALAERVTNEAGTSDDAVQIALAFELAVGRPATAGETAAAARLIEQYGLSAFCRAILNASEMIYLN